MTSVCLMVEFCVADDFEDRLHDNLLFSSPPKEIAFGMLCVLLSINVPLFVLDLQLVGLHMLLTWNSMTTHEYILNKLKLQSSTSTSTLGVRLKMERAMRCLDWIIFVRAKRRRRSATERQRPQVRCESQDCYPEVFKVAPQISEVLSPLPLESEVPKICPTLCINKPEPDCLTPVASAVHVEGSCDTLYSEVVAVGDVALDPVTPTARWSANRLARGSWS